jgi:mono/diheme cytochrome c family protein
MILSASCFAPFSSRPMSSLSLRSSGRSHGCDRRSKLWAGIGLLLVMVQALPAAEGVLAAGKASARPPAAAAGAVPSGRSVAGEEAALAQFRTVISPMLEKHCYDCHGDGAKKGGLAFDELTTKEQILHNPSLWLKVLRNTRSHIMPPPEEAQPTPAQQLALEQWIKTGAFGLDLNRQDPGRVTVRRLNRTEYRNTIRDLVGITFDTEHALAADDIGYGFDTIGDVLSLSPMRMEKFIEAAQAVVKKGVPSEPTAISEQMALGKDFLTEDGTKNGDPMNFYQDRKVAHTFTISIPGDYRIVMATSVDGSGNPDPARAKGTMFCDGKEFYSQEYAWADCMYYQNERVLRLEPGEHKMEFVLEPVDRTLKQRGSPERPIKMDLKLVWTQVAGPLDRKDWAPSPNYGRFFPRARAPESEAERRVYAREVLTQFAAKAYRRPVSPALIERLVMLAESVYKTPGTTFEVGISRAIVAILASPRFIFRFEDVEPAVANESYANVDEYSLASRLSYFLWSSMPDDTLLKLASTGALRKNLAAQVERMLADPKADAFVENFSGQWLLSREVSHIALSRQIVLAREGIKPAPARRGFVAPTDLLPVERDALKKEAEAYFGYVVRENRNILELIDSDYAFVNEALATYYGMPEDTAKGPEMRKITLPAGDPRGGGVITMGSVLAVTSNPTRTSPVKRGKWILENILGAPAPPPPPAVPSLEETEKKISDRVPTQRELLAKHREDALCASCHNRMDPLGLALESFNAMGLYRTQELDQPVDSTGELFTGEPFKNVRDLKRILSTSHRREFYLTLTEKLMIYSLGRGVEYYDVPTMDKIVERLERNGGRFSEILMGVIESAPFQQRRAGEPAATPDPKLVSLTSSNQAPQ